MTRGAVVTVGSTEFSSLVEAALSPSFFAQLRRLSITTLLVQHGTGTLPISWRKENINGTQITTLKEFGLAVDVTDFTSNIDYLIATSVLVVTHAGAGSILAALRADTTLATPMLFVVPNTNLMDSHQADLADAVSRNGWGTATRPEDLSTALAAVDISSHGPAQNSFPQSDFMGFVEQEMGLVRSV